MEDHTSNMNRRDFLKLVVTACVASALPLDKAFASVSAETGYLDDLIVSMRESLDKQSVIVETSRWFTTREAFHIKNEWNRVLAGVEHWQEALFRDAREFFIHSLTDKKPEGARHCPADPHDVKTADKWFKMITDYDGQKIDIEVMNECKVLTLMPQPTSYEDSWVGDQKRAQQKQGKRNVVSWTEWTEVKDK